MKIFIVIVTRFFTIILDNKQIFEGFSIYAPTDIGLI